MVTNRGNFESTPDTTPYTKLALGTTGSTFSPIWDKKEVSDEVKTLRDKEYLTEVAARNGKTLDELMESLKTNN